MYHFLLAVSIIVSIVSLGAILVLLSRTGGRKVATLEMTLEAVERDRVKAEQDIRAELLQIKEGVGAASERARRDCQVLAEHLTKELTALGQRITALSEVAKPVKKVAKRAGKKTTKKAATRPARKAAAR